MATWIQQYTCGTTPDFQHRVEAALLRHVHFTLAATPDQPAVNLCRQILADSGAWAVKLAKSAATEPGLAAEIGGDATGATIPDTGTDSIESAIQTLFTHYL